MTIEEKLIFTSFNGKLVGSSLMKKWVCKTLAQTNGEIIDFVNKNCWFVSSMEDAWAFTFTGNDLADMHLIFLGEELFSESGKQIQYTIAHEIGHVMLGHRNSTIVRQSKDEVKNQERQADEFAKSLGFSI